MGVSVHEFLAVFFPDENEMVCLRAFKPRDAQIMSDNYPVKLQTTRHDLKNESVIRDQILNWNETRGIYFVVNSGGDEDKDITRFNAFFVESDTATIQEQHEALDRSPIQPSIRVQTKKSVHAYWLIDGVCSEQDWRDVQARLISHFGGDVKIKNPSRVMRLPWFNHLSLENGQLQKQRVEITFYDPNFRVSAATMQGAFNPVPQLGGDPPRVYSTGLYVTWDALNAELRRRILAHPATKVRGEWAHSRGVCHQGKGDTALALNVATGAYSCQAGCKTSQILEAFALPPLPNGLVVGVHVSQSSQSDDQVDTDTGIYRVSDLRAKVIDLYKHGRTSGHSPGWPCLEKYYTVKRGQFTVVTGIPNTGKTPFLDNIAMNLAQSENWKIGVCSLENSAIEDHLSTLIEIYTGQPFSDGPDPRVGSQRMSLDVVEKSLDWFEEHFFFIQPPEANRTIPVLIDLVTKLQVDGVIVDPWNEFEHRRAPAMTETEYVSLALSKMRNHARSNGQHWWLVAHPTKLTKDKEGNYPVPTLWDCSGSANFRNKPDMGLVLWRDLLEENGPTTVFVQKVKYRWCGRVGKCELYYDIITGRYYDPDHYQQDAQPSYYYQRETF